MVRKPILSIVIVVIIFSSMFAAYSGGWGGIRVTGGSLRVQGQGYGLGKIDEAAIQATLSGYLICVNNGGNIAPGQNSYATILSQTQAVTVRNGKFDFDFFFSDDDFGYAPTDWEAAGCPNANWTVDYLHDRLTFTLYPVADETVSTRKAATFECVMNPPALSGEYNCTQG